MDRLDTLLALNKTGQMLMSMRSALDIPSFQQLVLLVGVVFYLITSLLVSLVLQLTHNLSSPLVVSTLNSLLPHSGPTVQIVNKLISQVNQFFYWTGLSSGCVEALVCGAGKSMGSDFPKISVNLKKTIETIFSSNMGNQIDRYTRLLLDAMVGQGECQERVTFDCSALKSSGQPALNTTNHGTQVAQVFAQEIYLKTISRIALLASTFIATMLTIFIAGFLVIILNRKPRRQRKLSSPNHLLKQEEYMDDKVFYMVKQLREMVPRKNL